MTYKYVAICSRTRKVILIKDTRKEVEEETRFNFFVEIYKVDDSVKIGDTITK